MIILSPRAVERLESYRPPWPVPKVMRLTSDSKVRRPHLALAPIPSPTAPPAARRSSLRASSAATPSTHRPCCAWRTTPTRWRGRTPLVACLPSSGSVQRPHRPRRPDPCASAPTSLTTASVLSQRSKDNLAAVEEFVLRTDWCSFLAKEVGTISNTSVCLELDGVSADQIKIMQEALESEGVAFDIGSYRCAPGPPTPRSHHPHTP